MTALTHGLRIAAACGALALAYGGDLNAGLITHTLDACDHEVGTDASSVAKGATLAMMSRDQEADTFVYEPALIEAGFKGDLPLTGCGRTIGSVTNAGLEFYSFLTGSNTDWHDFLPFSALRVDFTPRVREVFITGWSASPDQLIAFLFGPGDQYFGDWEVAQIVRYDEDNELLDWQLSFSLAGQMPLAYMVLAGWSDSNAFVTSISYSVQVPEPATLALLGLGLVGMGFARRRKAH